MSTIDSAIESEVLKLFRDYRAYRIGNRLKLIDLEGEWERLPFRGGDLYAAIERLERRRALITILEGGDYLCVLAEPGAREITLLPSGWRETLRRLTDVVVRSSLEKRQRASGPAAGPGHHRRITDRPPMSDIPTQ